MTLKEWLSEDEWFRVKLIAIALMFLLVGVFEPR